ncbi:hypothetical protein GFY24_38790 [Nocardia sp. SYP-A9097]|uniref:hypothetical protein n=1 Tax=Nocardia sp. SYP-A9097 TaxID=2663237 RepID=UPI00129A2D12|nr:hypothetical protein [Nocardia sp. SYP-A9097]MRH93299.1 hypothetical protein [Nocardia sp. SYP-A9097]
MSNNDKRLRLVQQRPNAAELRHSYTQRFPAWMQPAITILTGKAAVGESLPPWVASPRRKSIQVIIQWLLATAVGLWLLSTHPLTGVLALPLLWLVQVNALRNFQVVVAHHAVHNELLAKKKHNYRLQVLVSTLSLTQHFEEYFETHVRGHHNGKRFTTENDPDSIFLVKLGFRPGESLATLRRRMRLAVVSPRFHAVFFAARLRTNFVTAPWHRKLVAAAYVGLLAVPALLVPWWVFMLAVLMPLVPLYHVAAFLQLLSEHAWTITSQSPTRSEYAERTWGRFFLEPLPEPDRAGFARITGWTHWALRVALIHLPSRFAVVIGDMVGHDLHHLHPAYHDWTTTLWTRQERIDTGNDPRGMSKREFTSLAEVLIHVLRRIADTQVPTPAAGVRLDDDGHDLTDAA